MKKTNTLLLFKTMSERLDKNGKPYEDYYLVSKQGDSLKKMRVYCTFIIDRKKFDSLAVRIESLDELEKHC